MRIWRWMEWLIDGLAEVLGRIGWLLLLYCMVFGVTDVFLRYVMNAPTQWIGTTMQAAMVLIACLGGAYALNHDAFVKLDIFYANKPRRTRAVLDVITSVFTFLFLYAIIWKGMDAALMSYRLNQVTPTVVPIPIYPIKSAIPLTGVIIMIIVIRQLAENVHIIVTGRGTRDERTE